MKILGLTDTGKSRIMNQDCIFVSEEPVGRLSNLMIVADGMGGEKAGDYASRNLIDTMVDYISGARANYTSQTLLRKAIEKANRKLYTKSRIDSSYDGMGTTVVAATYEKNTLIVANVGDSRLYRITDGIVQVTKDHSYVEELVEQGSISRYSDEYVKYKNLITRAAGTESSIDVDFFEVEPDEKDIILICTDGLSNMLSDDEIFNIVKKSRTLNSAAHKLIDAANAAGGKDNISVILASEFESEVER